MVQQASFIPRRAKPVLAAPARDRPVALPHVEWHDGRLLFAGEPTDSGLNSEADRALLERCDGHAALPEFTEAERARIHEWRTEGIVVLTPPPRSAGQPLIISPHPDDAVLALGGLLSTSGGLVLDVFSAETWTRRRHYADRPELASRILLAEEDLACRVVGAQPRYLGFLDAAIRPQWTSGFLVPDSVSGSVAERDAELCAELRAAIEPWLPSTGYIHVPLGVGGHVDHLLCREAVLQLALGGSLPPSRLVFYEDQPYSLFSDAARLADELSRRLDWPLLEPHLIDIGEREATAKHDAARCYRLQVTDGIVSRIARHDRKRAEAAHGPAAERVWTLAAA